MGAGGRLRAGFTARASVSPTAKVMQSAIGAGAVIGPDVKIVDSVIMANARIGAGAVIRDSVVGSGATVGAGASLSALSLIGDGYELEPGAALEGGRLPGQD